MKAAILGAGVIGAGWAARFVLHGWDVTVWDPDAGAGTRTLKTVDDARSALKALYDAPLPAEGDLEVCNNLQEALRDADWIQESLPEVLTLKQDLYTQIGPGTAVASSTSGFKPSDLIPDVGYRIFVCHPFNPVYLLPGVEIVPGNTGLADMAVNVLTDVGMLPVVVDVEIDAHVADRLLEAVWREALWLVRDGVASTSEIDAVIKTTFGLRWANMGLFETYRLGGGDGGFRHFLAQFGPALKWPWSRLTDVPELDDALVDRIVEQTETNESVDDMMARRDRNLVAILRALKSVDDGAGAGLNAYEATLKS